MKDHNKKTGIAKAFLTFLGVAAAILMLPHPALAQGQGWRFEPVLKLGLVSDDNARLSTRTDEEIDLSGYILDASANVYYESSQINTFSLQPRVASRSYPGESQFDSDDFFLRSQFNHRGQTATFGIGVNFDQQSVRTGERSGSNLDVDDPAELPNDDSGLVGLDGDRSRWRISPYWHYRLSNISSVNLDFDYYSTEYDDVFAGLLIDYTDMRLSTSYRRTLSSTTTAVFTATGRRFEPDASPDDITGYGALVGIERDLSPKTRLVAMIGAENTKQLNGESDSELVGNLTLTRELELINLFARYQRTVSGNGTGIVEARDTVNVSVKRRLNERITAGLGARAYHAERVGATNSAEDRNYVQLEMLFSWYLSRAFIIEADYRYTILDRSNTVGERSNSNQVGIWFVYQPNTTPKL